MMYPFWVLLSAQVPEQIWQHNGRRPAWTWMGNYEHLSKLTVTLKKYREWHLKYHKDKKAWHNHTGTPGTPTLIQIPQHLRSSNEDDPGSPCSFSSRLPVRQVCWSNPFYVELNIGSTKAIWVKTMPERKGRQKDARSQGKLSIRLFPINLISKQLN